MGTRAFISLLLKPLHFEKKKIPDDPSWETGWIGLNPLVKAVRLTADVRFFFSDATSFVQRLLLTPNNKKKIN